jgi:hypothetical protein
MAFPTTTHQRSDGRWEAIVCLRGRHAAVYADTPEDAIYHVRKLALSRMDVQRTPQPQGDTGQ